jgi:Protein of unknown function (DUF2442)
MSFSEWKTMNNKQPMPRDEERPMRVDFTNKVLSVTLKDGRIISTPLEWYPALEKATDAQRANYTLSPSGVHWSDLDEDLSVSGMLKGNRPPPQVKRKATTQEG